ncbi:MAG: ATP-binding protein, partial [Victivallales bacterium]|nr:ATP-binding protein [Victivallales bacterium]
GHDYPEAAVAIAAAEAKLKANGEPIALQLHFDRNGGTDFVIYKTLLRNDAGKPEYIVSAAIDVTELKRTENALKIASQQLNTILNVMHEIIIWFDRDMKVVWANRAASEALGGSATAELTGLSCRELWFGRKDGSRCEPCVFRSILESGQSGNETLRLADGQIYQAWFYPVRNGDEVGGWVQLAMDVTEQERVRREARLRQEQLIQADKMMALGILVSGVAHEINNPNNFIVINISILKKAWDNIMSLMRDYARERGDFNVAGVPFSRFSTMVNDLLDGIEEGADRIRVIVNDLKNYVRQTPADFKGRFGINDALSRAFMLCRNMLKRASGNYRIIYGDDLPLIRGDVYRIEQVIINIVQNACQALKNTENAIIVKTYRDAERDEVVLEVSDEGVGISPEQMKYIADPFYTTKRESGGIGLGLSISKSIVEEHGGRLAIQSRPEQGTVVRIFLPPAVD